MGMVTAQVYIALCVAGVAVAAPQLDFGGLRSVVTTREVATSNINQERVVSDVVSALQPSIAEAVAAALAGLQTSTFSSSVSSTSSAAADAERAAFEAELAADVEVSAKPVYNFEYKVADAEAQTYISQSENRDGDTLTGMYSYVNPDGALITVNYEAGPVIPGDGGVVDVNHDDLEVLVGRVLSHPVRVQDPQTLESAANTLLSDGLKVPLWLLLLDSSGSLGLTIRTTLSNWALTASTPHGDTVDAEALLGLVPQPAGFVGPGWARCTVNLVQLAILPAPNSPC